MNEAYLKVQIERLERELAEVRAELKLTKEDLRWLKRAILITPSPKASAPGGCTDPKQLDLFS